MAYREFTDDRGVVWTAWDTYPESSERVGLGAFQTGWLTFQSGEERRRLFPIPADWAEAPEPALRQWARDAVSVTSKPAPAPPHAVRPIEVTPPSAAGRVGNFPGVSDEVRNLIQRSRETLESLERAISGHDEPMSASSSADAAPLERRRAERRG